MSQRRRKHFDKNDINIGQYLQSLDFFFFFFYVDLGTSDRDQHHPHRKERQKRKMAVWGGLTNSCEKKRSEKQKRKGKI